MRKVCLEYSIIMCCFSFCKFDFTEAIVSKIEESGFKISMSKETQLTKEMAYQLYSGHEGSEYFEELTEMMAR